MDINLTFRLATEDDLWAIVQLLLDDTLGALRENAGTILSESYARAFDAIRSDPNQELSVAELNGEVVATFQVTFIQYLTYQGGRRAQIEAVRTHSAYRGRGIGKKIIDYPIQRARDKGCHLVQLTTDKRRPDAIRFYESLGFVATHEGMKFKID
ncbi:GNAT family N-acetyltransferase [Spirosoma fluviale]|uniref:Transcriptional regulator n=1 Tax=Spirosoma fluviale TaxID=1597977 RepID=A0A286FFQ6_9BACT|nr:GNAT family N-acetyltransferase [Spirosoma fluviale]SOD82042.1 transcriptional regulator [Spirosoma fluviale]